MHMSAAELKFRHFLKSAMTGEWEITWHEDRHISPGVPDLHYVMIDEAAHRVGWLELKAMDVELSEIYRVRVEASQHQYMRRWLPRMPIHFLIRIKRAIYLVDGKHHSALTEIHNAHDMRLICTATCDQADIAKVLTPALKTLTRI
jgi:hypothetical protein